MQENQLCSCFKLPSNPTECQHNCWHDFLVALKREILDSTVEIKELINRKIPDPPLVLVSSKEVCKFVAIEPKTLYRCEKKNWIKCYLRNSKGKLYLQEDMIKLKKIYHNLPD